MQNILGVKIFAGISHPLPPAKRSLLRKIFQSPFRGLNSELSVHSLLFCVVCLLLFTTFCWILIYPLFATASLFLTLCYAMRALWRRYSFTSRYRAAELSPAHNSSYHLCSLCFRCHSGMKTKALASIFPAVSAALWSFGTHFLACLKRQASIPLLWLCLGTLPVQDTDYCEQNHRLFWARVIYVQLAA